MDLFGNRPHIIVVFFRIASAILIFHGFTLSGQQLRVPHDMNPAEMEIRPLFRQDTVTIRFFGDIMMHSMQIQKALKSDGTYDFSTYFAHMSEYLDDSDLNVGNMEFTLGGEPYSGYPAFSAPDSFADYLAECGFGLFLCANNHILDKGKAGLRRTLSKYHDLASDYGIRFTGAATDEEEMRRNTPLIINLKGIKVAFINATYGTNSPRGDGWPKTNILSDKAALASAFEQAGRRADICIALVHWGDEYVLKHNRKQEENAEWLAGQGADVIIGSHPHVVQDTDIINIEGRKVPVAYSLGNIVSNMSAKDTQAGLMATIRLIRHFNGDVEISSPEYRFTWCSRPGGYGNSYYVLPVSAFSDRKEEWKGKWEHDKMTSTIERVCRETGITENNNN